MMITLKARKIATLPTKVDLKVALNVKAHLIMLKVPGSATMLIQNIPRMRMELRQKSYVDKNSTNYTSRNEKHCFGEGFIC